MKNYIPLELYNHVDSVVVDGFTLSSSYNHNYYVGTDPKDIILEVCDDDSSFEYYRVNGAHLGELWGKPHVFLDDHYLGTGYFTTSIFEKEFDGVVENGIVELDTEIC